MKKICENCKNCFIDLSVNYYECQCENISEKEIDKYFTDGEEKCPYYIEE